MQMGNAQKPDGAGMLCFFSRPVSGRSRYETQRSPIPEGEGAPRIAERAGRHNRGTKAAAQSALTGKA